MDMFSYNDESYLYTITNVIAACKANEENDITNNGAELYCVMNARQKRIFIEHLRCLAIDLINKKLQDTNNELQRFQKLDLNFIGHDTENLSESSRAKKDRIAMIQARKEDVASLVQAVRNLNERKLKQLGAMRYKHMDAAEKENLLKISELTLNIINEDHPDDMKENECNLNGNAEPNLITSTNCKSQKHRVSKRKLLPSLYKQAQVKIMKVDEMNSRTCHDELSDSTSDPVSKKPKILSVKTLHGINKLRLHKK